MAIRVEFIRRRPGGRITVRPTVYEKNEITLGRATDCDIHLPDLRVGLHHARLIRLSEHKMRIEAGADHRVRMNTALVRRRDFPIERGVDIRIGPYQLTVSAADSDRDILVSIELVEPATAAGASRDTDRIFSVSGYAPDKRVSAWALVMFIGALFLALPIAVYMRGGESANERNKEITRLTLAANQNWLPGPMSSAHANLVADCRLCHEQAFNRVRDDVCLSCHADTHNHATAKALAAATPQRTTDEKWLAQLRRALNIPERRCGSCHFEHNGKNGVTPTSSAMCIECHAGLDRRIPETELVNVSNFSRWHPEFRPSVVFDPQKDRPVIKRISLVDHPRENNGLKFPHEFHLKDLEVERKLVSLDPLKRVRYGETLECVNCHQIDAAGALLAPIRMEHHCADCHSLAFIAQENAAPRFLPHGKPEEVRSTLEDFYLAQATTLLLGERSSDILERPLSADARARRERLRARAFADARENAQTMIARIFSKEGICQKCHTIEYPDDDENGAPRIAPVQLTDRYLPKARFKHAAHLTGNITCTDCHRAGASKDSSDVLLPSITVCRSCHIDAGAKSAISSDCLTCHGYHDDNKNAPPMTPTRAGGAPETRSEQ